MMKNSNDQTGAIGRRATTYESYKDSFIILRCYADNGQNLIQAYESFD